MFSCAHDHIVRDFNFGMRDRSGPRDSGGPVAMSLWEIGEEDMAWPTRFGFARQDSIIASSIPWKVMSPRWQVSGLNAT